MRKELKKLEDIRTVFTGTFVKYGVKNGYRGIEKTLLLKDIMDLNGNIVTDHLWFNLTKGFENLGVLTEGDTLQFNARCKPYEKGYKGYKDDVYKPIETDYRLSNPSKIIKINK